jgi:hypothetical protein
MDSIDMAIQLVKVKGDCAEIAKKECFLCPFIRICMDSNGNTKRYKAAKNFLLKEGRYESKNK